MAASKLFIAPFRLAIPGLREGGGREKLCGSKLVIGPLPISSAGPPSMGAPGVRSVPFR